MGRPKKNIEELPIGWEEKAIEIRSLGKSEASVWKEFGIAQSTHNRFMRENEEYREVMQYAKVCAEAYLTELLLDNVFSNTFKYAAIKFLLCAHFGYREQGTVDDELKTDKEKADEEEIRNKYKLKAV